MWRRRARIELGRLLKISQSRLVGIGFQVLNTQVVVRLHEFWIELGRPGEMSDRGGGILLTRRLHTLLEFLARFRGDLMPQFRRRDRAGGRMSHVLLRGEPY